MTMDMWKPENHQKAGEPIPLNFNAGPAAEDVEKIYGISITDPDLQKATDGRYYYKGELLYKVAADQHDASLDSAADIVRKAIKE